MEDILNALGVEKIVIYFQPIVSLQKLKVVGFEALSRGINQGEIVSPMSLFSLAKDLGCNLELDRICRKLALCEFKKIRQQYNDLLLFLNHDPSLLDKNGVTHGFTYQLVKEIGLPPRSIVIEVCESKVTNMDSLSQFVSDYKKYGFLLALDDVGNSHSNLNRIPELKPDILKIDRGLIKDVDKSWHKNKILKSISYLAREIRTLIIAEGVETKEEIMEILEIGVEFFQGFYFEKPIPPDKITFNNIENKLKENVLFFREQMIEKFKKRRKRFQYFSEFIIYIAGKLSRINEDKFENALRYLTHDYSDIECAYILNEYGIQITDTIFIHDLDLRKNSNLFLPAKKGDDLSSREYFYSLMYCDSLYYVTDPYLSRATGNKCITISNLFEHRGKKYILCVDIILD